MIPRDATLLRLYVHNDDRALGRPLYESVVRTARELGLAGATVFTAERGFGAHRVIRDALSEYTFVGAPVVIEVIDAPERIRSLLAAIAGMVGPGVEVLATTGPVRVHRDSHHPDPQP